MNKKGEGFSINLIVIFVIGIFVLVVVGFAVGSEYSGKVFPFLDNLPWFKSNSSVSDGPEILRYKLSDGTLEYYTGASWEEVSRTFYLNDKMLKSEEVVREFEDYFYGRGEYEEIYRERNIRKIPFSLEGFMIQDFWKMTRSSSQQLSEKFGVIGFFEENTKIFGFFYDLDGNLYFTKDGIKYDVVGRLEDISPSICDDLTGTESKVIVFSSVDYSPGLEKEHLKKMSSYVHKGAKFYERDSKGCAGKLTEYSLVQGTGEMSRYWQVSYKGEKIFIFYNDAKFYVRGPLIENYELKNSENYKPLVNQLIEWRDGILKVPINLPIDDSDSVSVCPEINSGYLIVRLENEVGKDASC